MPCILVVDDSEVVRQTVEWRLSSHGYEVLLAECGDIGLEIAANREIDLILIDVHMPGKNGIETLAKLREMPRHEKTPVLMLTAESPGRLVEKTRALGVKFWLIKPVNKSKLIRAVDQTVRRPKEPGNAA